MSKLVSIFVAFVALTIAPYTDIVSDVRAETVAPATATAEPESASTAAVEVEGTAVLPAAVSGTGALTATGTPAPGDLPGADLTVSEGIALGKLMVDAFKGGMWQVGIALAWFLLLAIFRRVYMPLLKDRLKKPARRILMGVLTWGTCTAGGVLGGVGILASLFGGFMLAGGVTLLWSFVGSIPFVKKWTGKTAEEKAAEAARTGG